MLSLNKSRAGYEVSCKVPDHAIKTRKFDDLEAHASAVRFARAAETVPEFRAFLFRDEPPRTKVTSYVCVREKPLTGGRYAVAMCRLDSGQLRSISFIRGEEESQVLGKAEQFLRSVAFENWRKQGPVVKTPGNQQHVAGKERALKHPHSFVEKDQGEKVDCKCGKNRSHGLMMACERCGVWEHAECQGYRNKKQIPAEYICSACVRAEREEVIIIRCEEQGRHWNTSSEDTHAGMAFREQVDRLPICCVCGCEDNEFFEHLVQPCSCSGCALLAHASCTTMAKGGASQKASQRSGLCCFCGSSVKDGLGSETRSQKGGRWVEEESKPVKGDQLGLARKRLRSTPGGSAAPVKAEHVEKPSSKSSNNEKDLNLVHSDKVQPEVSPTDAKKSASPFLGRRFSDAAANVPIKKRRIQLEMARSPSPPPGSLKSEPGIAAVHEVIEVAKPSGSQASEVKTAVAAELGGNRGGSLESLATAAVQKVDSEVPDAAALKTFEEDLIKGDKHMSPTVTASETHPEGSVVSVQCLKLEPSDVVAGCKSEKGAGDSEQRKGNMCVTENGTSDEKILVSQVDMQLQTLAAHTGSSSPTREREQVVIPEHPSSSGVLEMGRAGVQSEEVTKDLSREGGATLSPNSKRKFSETDMSHTARDLPEEFSKSRLVNRAGNANPQTSTSIAGSTREEPVLTLALSGNAMMETSTEVGKNNNLRDDRLHWDLNMDMEEWDRPSEEDDALAPSSVPSTEVEKTDCLNESGSASICFEERRLEQTRPIQESTDAISMLKTLGDNLDTCTVKEHDVTEDEPEVVCCSLEGDKSISASQKDHRHTELDQEAPAPDQEAEVLRGEELVSADVPTLDMETERRELPVAEKARTDSDICTSELTDIRADTSVHGEGICGTNSSKGTIDDSLEAAGVLQPENKLESHGDSLSQLVPSEGAMTSTSVPTSAVHVTDSSSFRKVTGLPECGDVGGASAEIEKLVDKEVVEEFVTDKNRSSTSPSKQPAPLKWVGDNGEDLEKVDYGDSDLREGEEHDVEERQRGASEGESIWKSSGETKIPDVPNALASESHKGDADDSSNVMGTRKRRYGSEITPAEESYGMNVERARAVPVFDRNRGSVPGKIATGPEMNGSSAVEEEKVRDEHGNGTASVATSDSHRGSLERTDDPTGVPRSDKAIRKSEIWRGPSESGGRVRTKSGWDQLPEGFQSAEEARQAARPNAGQSGWGSHYAPGFSGWNGSSSMHFNSSENRYLPGHGRGMLPGPAADRAVYDKTPWSRGDHPRRSRVDDGLDIHGRVPVNQELRQSRASLEPAHRQRRRGVWGDEAGAPPPMWGFGPGRHISPPGPSREPYGFHPHKTRNAAAVAAAKVESSGLVVAPDGTVIKAGVGAPAPLRGLGGKGRGGGFDIPTNGVMTGVGNTGLSHSLRIAGDVDLRSRECLDSRAAGGIADFKRTGERFGPSFPPGMARGATASRYRWTREERSFAPPVEQEDRNFPGKRRSVDRGSLPQSSRSRVSTPPRSPEDKPKVSEVVLEEPEPEAAPAPTPAGEPDAQTVVPPPPKLPLPPPPPRAQRSPPAGLKRLINKREEWPRGGERSRDKEREWDSKDRERASSRGHYSPSRRSSPHVIHGSALTDERDRLLLAGIDRNRDQGASSAEDAPSYRGRSMEDSHERRGRYYERAQSKDSTYRDAKESSRSEGDRSRGPSRDYKHSSSREGEDDVAPRRRRPS